MIYTLIAILFVAVFVLLTFQQAQLNYLYYFLGYRNRREIKGPEWFMKWPFKDGPVNWFFLVIYCLAYRSVSNCQE